MGNSKESTRWLVWDLSERSLQNCAEESGPSERWNLQIFEQKRDIERRFDICVQDGLQLSELG